MACTLWTRPQKGFRPAGRSGAADVLFALARTIPQTGLGRVLALSAAIGPICICKLSFREKERKTVVNPPAANESCCASFSDSCLPRAEGMEEVVVAMEEAAGANGEGGSGDGGGDRRQECRFRPQHALPRTKAPPQPTAYAHRSPRQVRRRRSWSPSCRIWPEPARRRRPHPPLLP
jgi:hypothetical protein